MLSRFLATTVTAHHKVRRRERHEASRIGGDGHGNVTRLLGSVTNLIDELRGLL